MFRHSFVSSLVCFLLFFSVSSSAQFNNSTYTDTLRISLSQAENLFLKKNFLLLSQHFNVESQRALILQAKLFKNPTFYYENNIYNPYSKQWFATQKGQQGVNGDPSTQGSFNWQINQLFSISGKRSKNISLAKTTTEISEFKFYDLLRNLRFQLRQNFVNLYYLEQTIKLYDKELATINSILCAYEQQFAKKNVAEIDVQRLKAFELSLESEKRGVTYNVAAAQNNLMILISSENYPYICPILSQQKIDHLAFHDLPILNLIDSAKLYRYDLKAAEYTLKYDRQYIGLQKANAVPDLSVGLNYVRNGNYVPNYYAANIGFDLPVFDRNQGNINSAQWTFRADSAAYRAVDLQMRKDIWQAVTQLFESDKQFQKFDPNFNVNYEKLMHGIIDNFKKRNLSIVDFINYYDSYKNSVIQYFQLQSDRLNDLESLNFTVGETLWDY